MSSLTPLLTKFARDLGGDAALVTPFQGDEESTLGDVLDKFKWDYTKREFVEKIPAILVIDVDFDEFDPRSCNYIIISLKESMNEYGQVKIFEVKELLSELVLGARINYLFQHMSALLRKQKKETTQASAWDIVEIKPNLFGISIDIRKGIELLKAIKKQNTQQVYGDQIDVYMNAYGRVKCPKCNISFDINSSSWDGENKIHKSCGQRLMILEKSA